MNKKILLVIIPILLFGMFSVTKAATVAELQAQIAALTAQIAQLQAQLAQIQTTTPQTIIPETGTWCHDFNTDLSFGNTGLEVEALQIAFERGGFVINSTEKTSKYFGTTTRSAVIEFQEKYASEILTPFGLFSGTGYVGEKTRAKLNIIYGCPKLPLIIISPNGGESWVNIDHVTDTASGNEKFLQYIQWTGGSNPHATDSVDAYLEQLINGQYIKIGRILPAGNGSIAWVVGVVSNPNCTFPDGVGNLPIPSDYCWLKTNMKVVPPGQYYVHLIDRITKSEDRSNAPFSIVSSTTQPSITLLSPNGGETLYEGQQFEIRWTAGNVPSTSTFTIGIENKDGASGYIITGLSSTQRSFLWTVDIPPLAFGAKYQSLASLTTLAQTIPPEQQQYKISIWEIGSSYRTGDGSDNYFTILPSTQPYVTIISPNGREVWMVGETHDITWRSSGIEKLYIGIRCTKGGILHSFTAPNIARDVPASLEKFSWKVDVDSDHAVPTELSPSMCDAYKIAIGSEVQTGKAEIISGVSDESYSDFYIRSSTQPFISEITPPSGSQGQTVNLVINGGNFSGAGNYSGCGISPVQDRGFQLTGCKEVSDTQINATYSISSTAETEQRFISVSVPGKGTSFPMSFNIFQLSNCFRYNPKITALNTPQYGTAGTRLSYNFDVTNNDANGCAPSNLNLIVSSCPAGWICTLANTNFTNITPGSPTKATLYITSPASTSEGSYNITVQVENVSSSLKNIQAIVYNVSTTGCTRNAPLVTINPASQSGSPGTTLTYTVNVTNADSAACNSSNIALMYASHCPSGWTCTLAPAIAYSLTPGATFSNTLKVTPPAGTQVGSYSMTLVGTNLQSILTGIEAKIEYIVPSTTACTDSDGGRNYNTSGYVLDNGQKYTDYCIGNSLKEYFCLPTSSSGLGGVAEEIYNCPGFCSGGACISSIPSYTLTVTKAGTGTGTVISSPAGIGCGATCSSSYASGTSVTLAAGPAIGSVFAGWSGGGCSGTGDCNVIMDSDKTITATFSLATNPNFTLTVNKAGNGNGGVLFNPPDFDFTLPHSQSYPAGTSVTLIADPLVNSSFAGWSGGGCIGTEPCTITMKNDTTITATFNLSTVVHHFIWFSKGGTGSGAVISIPAGINCGSACYAEFATGTSVTLTATPAPGSVFAGWSGVSGCSGTGSCTVTTDTEIWLIAYFNLVTPPPSGGRTSWNESCGIASKGGCSCSTMSWACGGRPSCTYTCPVRNNATASSSCIYSYTGMCEVETAPSCNTAIDCREGFSCNLTGGNCTYTCNSGYKDANNSMSDGCEAAVTASTPNIGIMESMLASIADAISNLSEILKSLGGY